jgi:hypothetical protein
MLTLTSHLELLNAIVPVRCQHNSHGYEWTKMSIVKVLKKKKGDAWCSRGTVGEVLKQKIWRDRMTSQEIFIM